MSPIALLLLLLPLQAGATGAVIAPALRGAAWVQGPPASAVEPWAVTPEMRAWLERAVNPVGTEDQRMMRLLRALEHRDLVYEDDATRTGAEVFDSGRYNCLGLAHLVVGLGRELGVHAYYVRVLNGSAYDQRGDLVITASHVAAGWGVPAQIRLVEFGQPDPTTRPVRRVEDRSATALHYTNRGAEMLVAGQPFLAEDWLVQATSLDGSAPEAWVNLGVAERRLGHVALAQAAYLEALALDPNHAPAMRNLAALHELAGDDSAARSLLDGLDRSQLRNPFTNLVLGDLHVRTGDPDGARHFYRRARRLAPRTAATLAGRGQGALIRGDRDAARRWLHRAQQVDPQHPRVVQLSQRLPEN